MKFLFSLVIWALSSQAWAEDSRLSPTSTPPSTQKMPPVQMNPSSGTLDTNRDLSTQTSEKPVVGAPSSQSTAYTERIRRAQQQLDRIETHPQSTRVNDSEKMWSTKVDALRKQLVDVDRQISSLHKIPAKSSAGQKRALERNLENIEKEIAVLSHEG